MKVADRRDRNRNLSLRKRFTNPCTTGLRGQGAGEFKSVPAADRFDDRFDNASRFDSSQTPPPLDSQPYFPVEPHSDVSAQVLQLEAENRQLQLELRALVQFKSDSCIRLSASPTPAMAMPTQLERFVARQTNSSLPTFSDAA